MSEMLLFKWRKSVYTGSLLIVTNFRFNWEGEEVGITRVLGHSSSGLLNFNDVTHAHMFTKDSIRLQRRVI